MTGRVPERSVPRAKITQYLLKADHEEGASKARYFMRFGFAPDRWETLALALREHPDRNPLEGMSEGRWGTKYAVRCRIRSPDDRDPCILSVWIVPPGRNEAVLVTAYPADETV